MSGVEWSRISWIQEESNAVRAKQIQNVEGYLRETLPDRGLNYSDINTFVRIAREESQFKVNAVGYAEIPNCGRAMGIFQILPCTWKWIGCKGDYFDVNDQIDCALKVKEAQGWHAWEVY